MKKNKLRNLEGEEIEYYGMKKFTFEKEFFNYNVLELKIKGTSICDVEPSTGVVSNTFNICFSKICKKFKLANQQTNLHIIIDRMNKMTFDFITLLSKSNNELLKNNSIWRYNFRNRKKYITFISAIFRLFRDIHRFFK